MPTWTCFPTLSELVTSDSEILNLVDFTVRINCSIGIILRQPGSLMSIYQRNLRMNLERCLLLSLLEEKKFKSFHWILIKDRLYSCLSLTSWFKKYKKKIIWIRYGSAKFHLLSLSRKILFCGLMINRQTTSNRSITSFKWKI